METVTLYQKFFSEISNHFNGKNGLIKKGVESFSKCLESYRELLSLTQINILTEKDLQTIENIMIKATNYIDTGKMMIMTTDFDNVLLPYSDSKKSHFLQVKQVTLSKGDLTSSVSSGSSRLEVSSQQI